MNALTTKYSEKAERITWWMGIVCLVILFWVAMNYTSRNMGGSGVQVPYNTFAWLAASLFVLVALGRVLLARKLLLHTSTIYYAGALVCFFLPLIYSDRLFLDIEMLRIVGMLSGLLFFVALQQFVGARFNSYLLWILLASTAIQTVWGLIQYYFIFESSRFFWSAAQGSPYGVFQQVNVFTVYLALGSMLSLWGVSRSRVRSKWLLTSVAILIFANAHLAVLSVADTARFVGLVSVLSYLVYLRAGQTLSTNCTILFAVALCFGSFTPKTFFDVRPDSKLEVASASQLASSSINDSKTSYRLIDTAPTMSTNPTESALGTRPTIYAVSLAMFLDKPLTGHGIGTFRKQYLLYQGEYLKHHPTAPAEFNLSHPHNEPLYWMVELGALPLVGFLLVLSAWFLSVRLGTLDLTTLLVGLPLVLQSLLELPFYHSVAHYLSFVVILVASMNIGGMKSFSVSRWFALFIGPLALWLAAKAWVFLLSTYYALLMFLLFNASGRENVNYLLEVNNPSAFKLRYEFELFQWQLRRAREKGEIDLEQLNGYLRWAFSTVQYAPMQTTYENFVASLVLINNKAPARRYLDEGLLMYPNSEKLRAFDRQLSVMEAADE